MVDRVLCLFDVMSTKISDAFVARAFVILQPAMTFCTRATFSYFPSALPTYESGFGNLIQKEIENVKQKALTS